MPPGRLVRRPHRAGCQPGSSETAVTTYSMGGGRASGWRRRAQEGEREEGRRTERCVEFKQPACAVVAGARSPGAGQRTGSASRLQAEIPGETRFHF